MTTTSGSLASSSVAFGERGPDHLIVLVHGILARYMRVNFSEYSGRLRSVLWISRRLTLNLKVEKLKKEIYFILRDLISYVFLISTSVETLNTLRRVWVM